MKIILLGSSGQLGKEFEKFLSQNKSVVLYSFSHNELDILNLDTLLNEFKDVKPDVVINCAAYTKVDKVEEEQDLAYRVNAIGSKNVAFAAFRVNAKVVYFSTDYVFDGNKGSPYIEFDKPNPLSVYGKSKLFGEKYTKEFNPNHLILRISWLYGIRGDNFVKTIIKLSRENKTLRVVDDQIGTPSYTLDVVKQAWELVEKDYVGLFHSSNEGAVSWFGFANEIVKRLNLNIDVVPIKTEEYKTKAIRPKYSVLGNYLLKLENLNIMGHWERAFDDFIKTYRKELLSGVS